jgi:hypothetical protein
MHVHRHSSTSTPTESNQCEHPALPMEHWRSWHPQEALDVGLLEVAARRVLQGKSRLRLLPNRSFCISCSASQLLITGGHSSTVGPGRSGPRRATSWFYHPHTLMS